ncbi:MAG: hypothetical protein PUA51_05675 [Oscillospiraceae bacterium]|nr:hypothetical protein [Oscillospiraceae bacterium]
MDLQEMYNTAVGIIESLRTAGGSYDVSENSSVCVLLAMSGRVYSGVTGTAFENGAMKISCPEYNAVVSMMTAGETRIVKMMTVMFRNGEVVLPCEECRNLIFRINSENIGCEIALSKSGTIALGVLMPGSTLQNNSNIMDNNIQQTDEFVDFEEAPVQQDNTSEISSDSKYSFGFESSGGNVFTSPERLKVETAGDKNNSEEESGSSQSSAEYVNNIMADEDNPFYEPPVKEESNIVRDGNIEFEMYNPNKPAKIPKPKALNQIPTSSLNPDTNNAQPTNNYYNGSYNSDVQYNPSPGYANPIYSESSSEQYQSPYKHSRASTSVSSYYSSSQGSSGDSIYRQKLSSILNNTTPPSSALSQSSPQNPTPEPAPTPAPPQKLSKLEMLKYAKEKKRLAKIDAKFQKKIKKKGY